MDFEAAASHPPAGLYPRYQFHRASRGTIDLRGEAIFDAGRVALQIRSQCAGHAGSEPFGRDVAAAGYFRPAARTYRDQTVDAG